jgi:hypothetical protein
MPKRPGLRDVARRILAALTCGRLRATLPIETATGLESFPLVYAPTRLLLRMLTEAGLELVSRRGVNCLASLLPRTSLSVSYRAAGPTRAPGRVERWLADADERLAGRLADLAGIQLIVARKVTVPPAHSRSGRPRRRRPARGRPQTSVGAPLALASVRRR